MAMCIHSQEFETCRFGCTLRKAEELRLELDRLHTKNKWLKRKIARVKRLQKTYADNSNSIISGQYVAQAINQTLEKP